MTRIAELTGERNHENPINIGVPMGFSISNDYSVSARGFNTGQPSPESTSEKSPKNDDSVSGFAEAFAGNMRDRCSRSAMNCGQCAGRGQAGLKSTLPLAALLVLGRRSA